MLKGRLSWAILKIASNQWVTKNGRHFIPYLFSIVMYVMNYLYNIEVYLYAEAMNQEAIMTVLPDYAERAISMWKIARVIGL